MGAESAVVGCLPEVSQPVLEQAQSEQADEAMIRPTKNKVLLRKLPESNLSPGGLFIPQQAQENMQSQFTVVAVGPEFTEVKPGETVLSNTFSGTELLLGGAKYRMVEGSSILAILDTSA